MRIACSGMMVAAMVIGISAAACAQATQPGTTRPAGKTGTISGIVVYPNGQPLGGAAVGYVEATTTLHSLSPQAGTGVVSDGDMERPVGMNRVTTNDKGEFTIKDVPAGTWNVVVTLTHPPARTTNGLPAGSHAQTLRAGIVVKENEETRIAEPLKIAEPVNRGGGR